MNLKKLNIGSWITIGNIAVAEVMSSFNFDWLCIDMEHSVISDYEMSCIISILEKNNCFPVVRVGKNDELQIKKALDAGAKAIIIPKICNKRDAIKAVNFSRYQPRGERGVGLARAQGYGFNFENYLNKHEKKIKVIALIEDKEAIENLEDILEVSGIDGSIIGPYDLSASYQKPGNFDHSIIRDAIQKYEKISKKLNKPIGFHAVNNPKREINKMVKKGYKLIAVGIDTMFLGKSCDIILKEIKR